MLIMWLMIRKDNDDNYTKNTSDLLNVSLV